MGTRLAAGSCVFFAFLTFACGDTDPPEGPTYSEDVAPILREHCASCHQNGGIAPFALTDYAAARAQASDIAEQTSKRAMPPMPVNNDGSCNTYSNARWLTKEEIATLSDWAKNGAPEGATHADLAPPELPTLENPDAIVDIGTDYVPDDRNGPDDYRCFVVPAPTSERAFLTEYQVFPGDARVVHHLIVYEPASADAVAAAHALDDAEDGLGYTCFGSSRIDATPLALWAPGAGSIAVPAGTGLEVAKNRELVVQIHYNVENGVHPDRTRIGLRFASEPVITGYYWDVADTDLVAPPGQARVTTSSSTPFKQPTSFKVHGAMPHMHTLGKTLHAEVGAEQSQCLVDVDRWDFHWQNAWWYAEPLTVTNASELSITCGYDTTSRSDTVRWGDATSDEMCISYFYVTTSDAPDPVVSCSDAENPLFGSCLDALLDGCFEPDRGGECHNTGTVLTWSDGSKIDIATDPGLYGPGDKKPCVAIDAGKNGVTLTRGSDTLTYADGGDHVTFTCPDGSTLTSTGFQLNEFGQCRGLSCPQ